MPGVAEKMKAAAEKNSTTTATHHNTTSDNSNGQPKMSAKSAAFGRVEASSLGVSSIFSIALAVILA
ncbi:hypothetical protein PGTUg99_035666 [Puccinia graminis f. sp. tritici]|nr:hypothetical protein PGTUg99_035666 [Puccinia graminis f. sp. tritici]